MPIAAAALLEVKAMERVTMALADLEQDQRHRVIVWAFNSLLDHEDREWYISRLGSDRAAAVEQSSPSEAS